jgi:hypothetical protein
VVRTVEELSRPLKTQLSVEGEEVVVWQRDGR